MSRSLLTKRLHELARSGLVVIQPKPDAHGSFNEPTPLGGPPAGYSRPSPSGPRTGPRSVPNTPIPASCCSPGVATRCATTGFPAAGWWSGSSSSRAAVTSDRGCCSRKARGEICNFDPGFGDDLVVAIADPLTFTRWHLGLTSWAGALRSGGVQISGPPALRRALPTWNAAPELARRRLAEYQRGRAGLSWSAELSSPPKP